MKGRRREVMMGIENPNTAGRSLFWREVLSKVGDIEAWLNAGEHKLKAQEKDHKAGRQVSCGPRRRAGGRMGSSCSGGKAIALYALGRKEGRYSYGFRNCVNLVGECFVGLNFLLKVGDKGKFLFPNHSVNPVS